MRFDRLCALRLQRGLTQQHVANELHLSRAAISAYENGRRIPTVDILILLADYYQTSTDYLLGISSERERPPALDQRGREILKNYLLSDEHCRSLLYSQTLLTQELLHYQTEPMPPEPPLSPVPSPSENRK